MIKRPAAHDPIEINVDSLLAAPAARVWSTVSTMEGINAELRPVVKMTVPPDLRSRQLGRWALELAGESAGNSAATSSRPAVRSWLLLGGVVPIDRHRFGLESLVDGPDTWGFDEESTSWLQRRWRHERRVVTVDDTTCRVTDRVVVVPRLRLARVVVAPIVSAVFRHRHRRLVQRFGTPEA